MWRLLPADEERGGELTKISSAENAQQHTLSLRIFGKTFVLIASDRGFTHIDSAAARIA
ncbi:hypothetical protein M2323_001894 [Rhodoblastus acidophilus]|uniref:hypothetical protein n=1 Tax=Rhodoblastus acidophilus TaxID=1074 RepID=UPI002224C88C|nr:hypothetical protein [Rhodoblastus acidophilus]MCW2283674.1 hypothetical protein [Rhodoblastus acidophilus]MCW2332977.1 hypothetical protein [Rhodoblastus acidophilus]